MVCAVSFLLPALSQVPLLLAQNGKVAVLNKVVQIRRLSAEQAARKLPVRVRGIVIDDIPTPDFFIHDGESGIFVKGYSQTNGPHPHLGDLIEVTGYSNSGDFAPVIIETGVKILRQAPAVPPLQLKLPAPKLWDFNAISTGVEDSQWGSIEGIVRTVAVDNRSWKETVLAMTVKSSQGTIEVRVPLLDAASLHQNYASMVDSTIRITGVCGTIFNNQRQLLGVLFYVPRMQFIEVLSSASRIPISNLMQFHPAPGETHRVRVRGIVSFQIPGKNIFIQEAGHGARVVTSERTPLHLGDIVEVLGFPAVGESSPVLEDATYRVIGHDQPPSPVVTGSSQLFDMHYDGLLVTVHGRVLRKTTFTSGKAGILVDSGDRVIEAQVDANNAAYRELQPDAKVAITGICLVRNGGLWRTPESTQLLVRSAGDIQVLELPSWWTARHIFWLLVITFSALVLAILWVAILGRRVRAQMEVIRQKLKRGAVLEERHRIARELHDTLEQDLVGITLHLDLAADRFKDDPDVAWHALQMGQKMSRHSMIEARRSVWGLRSEWLEKGDLLTALRESTRPHRTEDAEVVIHSSGVPRRLDRSVEMNLLRIGQEAIVNALKHANAKKIVLTLEYHSDRVKLSVADDGCGFIQDQRSFVNGGHFGLLDMKERARSLGCDLLVNSSIGGGTRLEVVTEVKIEAAAQSGSD